MDCPSCENEEESPLQPIECEALMGLDTSSADNLCTAIRWRLTFLRQEYLQTLFNTVAETSTPESSSRFQTLRTLELRRKWSWLTTRRQKRGRAYSRNGGLYGIRTSAVSKTSRCGKRVNSLTETEQITEPLELNKERITNNNCYTNLGKGWVVMILSNGVITGFPELWDDWGTLDFTLKRNSGCKYKI